MTIVNYLYTCFNSTRLFFTPLRKGYHISKRVAVIHEKILCNRESISHSFRKNIFLVDSYKKKMGKIVSNLLLMISPILIYCSGTSKIITVKEYDSLLSYEYPEYVLGPGDEIEIFYSISSRDTLYRVQDGDELEILFYSNPELNKTVSILPNGMIYLPPEGTIRARGHSPQSLADTIASIFRSTITDPLVTVVPVSVNQRLIRFFEAIHDRASGNSRQVQIQPDGKIYFPLIHAVHAAGRSLEYLEKQTIQEYNTIFSHLDVSLSLRKAHNNIAYVLGEVERPGSYPLHQHMTLVQLLSLAKVNSEIAGLRSVVVLSRNKENKPVEKMVNIRRMIRNGNIGNDLMIKQFDVVYVPKTAIAHVNIFIKHYISGLIPHFLGINLGLSYDLNEEINH